MLSHGWGYGQAPLSGEICKVLCLHSTLNNDRKQLESETLAE